MELTRRGRPDRAVGDGILDRFLEAEQGEPTLNVALGFVDRVPDGGSRPLRGIEFA